MKTKVSSTVTRSTFLKRAGAVTLAAATANSMVDAAQAQPVSAPFVKRSPSGEILIWGQPPFTPAQVAAFNKVYPDVMVTQRATTYVPMTPSLVEQLVTGVNTPDGIFFIEDLYMGQYADILADVSAVLNPYLDAIVPYKLANLKYNGKLLGIPWDVTPAFLVYRTDIVAKAGVDVSKITTYDDLIAAAKQVKEAVPSCPKPLFFNTMSGVLTEMLEGLVWQQHSTGMLDANGKLQFTSAAYTNALTYLEKASKAGVSGTADWLFAPLYHVWNTGQAALMHFADWWTHWSQDGLKPIWGKIGLAPQPVFSPSDSPNSIIGGSAFVVPARAKNGHLAALFGAFQLFDPRALNVSNFASMNYVGSLPAAEKLWDLVHPPHPLLAPGVKEHQMLVSAAKNAPTEYRYTPWYGRALTYVAPIVQAVITGQMSAKAAQTALQQTVQTKVVDRYH